MSTNSNNKKEFSPVGELFEKRPPEKPAKTSDLRVHEYVPLKELFDGIKYERIDHIVRQLQDYVEKYREDRKEVCIGDYSEVHEEYLNNVKKAIKGELEAKRSKPKRKIIKGGLIVSIGYAVGVPLTLAFPVLLPFAPEVLTGLVAEESIRNIYRGVKEKKSINEDIALIDEMSLQDFAYALEDICYYPARTDLERNQLLLEEEKQHQRVKTAAERVGNTIGNKLYNKVYRRMRVPDKLRNYCKRAYKKIKYYTS